ncbi:hypothetical protein GPK87_10250 [Oscillibacter sp. MCC667]|uniref:S-layer homology domain-containing protein n=1 Tax=Dysosmobacter sp. TaxID=2591382 RepID=UPI001C013DDE|nr:hypothetical protein [Oscillibacter sp. MCC667]
MKRRILSSLMALVLVFGLLPATALAAEGESTTPAVYVSSAGDDTNGNGSEDKPFATLAKAVEAAENGATVYVMSDLNMTSCARFYNKSLTITSLGDATCTITRGDNFAQQQDNARSWYNPAMVEVQTTGGVGAGLTLTNIIFDDAGKKEGTVFAQAVSDGSVGAASNDNLVYVQDAIIASNATVTTTITLGDGAVLRNFGGMSAVRATGEAKLVMEPGSVIEDASSITRSKGDAGSVGPAGAVWLQGSDFEMENGAEIKNVNGRAVYADGGSVSVGGTISGIIGNPAMWQGKDGTAIHLRGSAKATLNGKISDCTEGVLVFVDKAVFEMATGSFLGNSDAAGIKTNEDPTWSLVNKDDYGTDRNTITIHGEISGIKNNKTPIQFKFGTLLIGADSNIHHNSVFYGTLYIQRDAIVDIYGKINNNDASSRGGGVATAGHGEVVINMYEGAEVKGNTAVKNGGGIMISSNTSFTMYGGEISGNVSQTVGGGIYQYKNNSKVELQGGTIRDNTMNATDVKDSSTGTENDITISNQGNGSSNHYLYISQNTELDNQNVYFQINSTTVTPAENSLDIKLGNASKESVTALSGKADANGWNAPLATFWAQRDGAAELTVGGLTFNKALPVYALVQETGADGKPVSGAEVRVYSTKITDDGIRLTLPNGYTNGCAVALAQPTTDFGSVGISGPTEIAKTSDAAPYEVPYTVTYTMSDSLRGMLNMASADIPAMSFVVELDSRLAAKTGDSGNCLYTFDGDGILDGTASVSGHTVTVTCTPLPGWKAAIAGKSSVKMVLKCAGLLDAAAFAAGESLNTAAHISGKVSSGSTVTSVVIPSSICRTRMTAQTYTVTYHRNGADSGETVDSRSYIFGDLAVVSENGYVRDGHSFVGWNTQRDGSGTHHVPGSSITVTDHIHLYAQWTRNSSGDDDDTGYTLRLTKLDAGDGTPLSGAKFELWRVGTRSDTRLGVYETNRYGWTQAEVSQSGDYYWVETVPPEGYRLGGGKHPTNTGKNSRITVYNTEAAVPALFTDDHYAYIVGGPDGTVRPNDSMTRAGVATIFFRLLKDSVRDANLLTGCTYTDVPDGHWANTAISTMTGLGIVQGRSTTTFDPKAPITRAQAMTMINRVLNRIPEDESDLLPGMNVWPDCNPGDWFYLAVQEATNSHNFEHKAGNYETWTKLMKNPDWTRYEN